MGGGNDEGSKGGRRWTEGEKGGRKRKEGGRELRRE